jgi:flavin-dependent dehydrogenase
MRQIAIAGGGPSGAMCGERLAKAGLDVTIYDEHLAWEKPCGGALTHKAVTAYPFLLDGPEPKKVVHQVEMISSDGERVRFALDHPIVIYSRAVLNGLLLTRAATAGCRIIGERVTRLHTDAPRVQVVAGAATQEVDFAVIAAGARNALLPGTAALEAGELEMTLGYFVPMQSDVLQVKFLRGIVGYAWSFPRWDHLSVGICGSMAVHTSQELRRALEEFVREEGIDCAGAKFYSHILPSPQERTLRDRPLVGKNWAVAGDAAALVDPLTGEGLHYALRSGDLLAQAMIAGQVSDYPCRLRKDFLAHLKTATLLAPRFYRGRFLGGAMPRRTIQFAGRSPTFRMLLRDVFSGAQDYRTLRLRLWMQLGRNIAEIAAHRIRRDLFGRGATAGEP